MVFGYDEYSCLYLSNAGVLTVSVRVISINELNIVRVIKDKINKTTKRRVDIR